MRKNFLKIILMSVFSLTAIAEEPKDTENFLRSVYEFMVKTPSFINEHLPTLYELSKQSESITELGTSPMISSWAMLTGLLDNDQDQKKYLGIDINFPPIERFNLSKNMAETLKIDFSFVQGDDMVLDIQETDLLFIDTQQSYRHLLFELEKFSPKAKKFIVIHNTSFPFGYIDQQDNPEMRIFMTPHNRYPAHISRTKQGKWQAVEDFLISHPEWKILDRQSHNHGLTILERQI